MGLEIQKELTVYPCMMIGGDSHGRTYMMNDRPCIIYAPRRTEDANVFARHLDDYMEPLSVDTYVRAEARVHGFDTPWIFYRHNSMDENTGMFALWDFLWHAAEKISRAGGWDKERSCPRCSGTGRDR